MKTLKQIGSDPRVQQAWDEDEDGYWVMLKAGWSFDFYGDNSHTIHEWTMKDLNLQFRTVKVCKCEECLGQQRGE